MSVELTGEARGRLDGHLDAVEKVLIESGRTREQRGAIIDDLESQILDMLAAKSAAPGRADVEAVLRQVDPPEAYREAQGASAEMPKVVPATQSGRTKWAFRCVLGSILVLVLCAAANGVLWSMLVADGSSREADHGGVAFGVLQLIVGLIEVLAAITGLVGTILGWIATVQIQASSGSLSGSGRALFAALFYPILLAGVLLIVLIVFVAKLAG